MRLACSFVRRCKCSMESGRCVKGGTHPRRRRTSRYYLKVEYLAHRAGEPRQHVPTVERIVFGQGHDRAIFTVNIHAARIRVSHPYKSNSVAVPHPRLVVDFSPAVARGGDLYHEVRDDFVVAWIPDVSKGASVRI